MLWNEGEKGSLDNKGQPFFLQIDTIYCKVYVKTIVNCDPVYENLTYSAKIFFLSYGYSLVEETLLFLKRPLT